MSNAIILSAVFSYQLFVKLRYPVQMITSTIRTCAPQAYYPAEAYSLKHTQADRLSTLKISTFQRI
jgi:hypothetical protein